MTTFNKKEKKPSPTMLYDFYKTSCFYINKKRTGVQNISLIFYSSHKTINTVLLEITDL